MQSGVLLQRVLALEAAADTLAGTLFDVADTAHGVVIQNHIHGRCAVEIGPVGELRWPGSNCVSILPHRPAPDDALSGVFSYSRQHRQQLHRHELVRASFQK
jgi:hypothetical protein